jgi:outer membrane protein assembly factor BamA
MFADRKLAPAALAALLALAGPAAAQTTETSTAALSSAVRAEEAPSLDIPRLILRLPEVLTELAFSPLLPLLLSFEKLHLHERIFDLLTNDARTFGVVPLFDFTNRSGLGAGLAILANDPLGSPDRTILYGLLRENGDRTVSFSYGRRLPQLSGKRFGFGAQYSLDSDARYFGIGGDSRKEDERALSIEGFDVYTSIEIPAPDEWNARIELAFRRRELTSGTGSLPPVSPGDSVEPPQGFGRALSYPEATLSLEYDTRDSNGRPTRGWVIAASASATHDIQNNETGGLFAEAHAGVYIPVLPLNRVLLLTLGTALASPLGRDNEIPFHTLLELGGGKTLRGYTSGRFVDRLGWWGTAEYRYHVFRYSELDASLSSTLFFDAGQVGRTPDDLFSAPLRWSVGVGFRLELSLFFLGRIQLAYSPDGPRIVIAVNELI